MDNLTEARLLGLVMSSLHPEADETGQQLENKTQV